MRRMILWRLAAMIPILISVSVVSFILMRALPGDYAQMLTGMTGDIPPEVLAAVRHEYGLDRPILVQYLDWLGSAVTGDLGTSFTTGLPVTTEISDRAGVTVQLSIIAAVLAMVIGVVTGAVSARRGGVADGVVRAWNALSLAVPNFVVATLIVLFVGLYAPGVPIFGYVPFLQNAGASIVSLLLPAVALALAVSVTISENTRAAILEVSSQDYVVVARAKGLARRTILWSYLGRNALTPVITVTGVQLAALLGGSILIETIFALPGIGQYLFDSVSHRDYPAIQGIVLLMAVIVLVINLVADIAYARVDARISYE